jgi:hypothetical protein
MSKTSPIIVLLIALVALAASKPVYNHKTSYVTQLTDFNFKDQVTKIRQNTNYVAIVHFYKYDGKTMSMQTASRWPLLPNWTSGSTSIMASSASEASTAMSTPRSAKTKA